MRHPFDGVIRPEQNGPIGHRPEADVPADNAESRSTRRSLLGALAAVFAGAGGLLVAGEASAKRYTTQALGEEGAGLPPRRGRRVTTFALGEEGGLPPRRGPRVTTLALGEEGGRRYW